jgi:hypothetical protein
LRQLAEELNVIAKKEKKAHPNDFKTTFAFSTMMWPVAASTTFIAGFFMQYLSDYSGIDFHCESISVLEKTVLLVKKANVSVRDNAPGKMILF